MNNEEKDRIEKCVVQIECINKLDTRDKELGTGFFIDKNIVITASHVIRNYYTNSSEYDIYVIPIKAGIDRNIKVEKIITKEKNNFVALLELEETLEIVNPLKFTLGYKIKRDYNYYSFGYPICARSGHPLNNTIANPINEHQSTKEDWKLSLTGERMEQFGAFSGAPVVIDNELIGIIQTESCAEGKIISINMSSTDMMKQYIPYEYYKEYNDVNIKWKIGFDYRNLDDVEFEYLCKDIMERKLNIRLRGCRKAIDGGICLDNNNDENNIIVQVKYHINNKFSNLKSSLIKEVDKIHQINPSQYYICCAQKLNTQNTTEVYELFKKYMKTKENVITIKGIDDFLQEERNKDIVRKHFKLWLYASNILSNINNQKRFIDCESLLANIETESKYYVQTNTYYKCIHLIDKLNILMIIGAPGVGKTTISKMLVLYYASLGYKVRYKTNGKVGNLKKEAFLDKNANDKEIILLDDCLGQHYFNMNENQETEIISLINLVKRNNNKKLILNSRVTIMNEAKGRSIDFEEIILKNKEKIYMINMDNISIDEKARILYNHMYFKDLPREYYDYVKRDKNYQRIVNHDNYTPRIIEYITEEDRYKNIKPDRYFDFVIRYLNNPESIWHNEYEKRLQPVDRILIKTLFSITDTTIDYSVLEECFCERLRIENNIDVTSNNFDNVINRLNKSMIKIIDKNNKKKISVLNPSVNDYIKNIFLKNINDLENVRKSIVYYEQLERCYSGKEVLDVIKEKIVDNTFKNLKVSDINICVNIQALLLHYICEFKILSSSYIDLIKDYILKLEDEPWIKNSIIIKSKIVHSFFQEPLFSFYEIDRHIRSLEFLESIL